MPITIDSAYIETFESNVRHLAQQGEALLRMKCTEKSSNGERHNWDRLAPSAAVQKTSKRTPTPYQDPNWTRRVSAAETWHWADSYEDEDIVQMLIDPQSALNMNGSMAMKRAADDIIIKAATSVAANGAGTTDAFPTSQIVGDYTTEITLDTVLQVNQVFQENDISMDIPRCLVISPRQVRSLLRTVEVTSADYQMIKALAGNGYLPNFLGFSWVISNRLNVPLADQIDCFAMTPYGVGLQVNADIKTKVAEDPSNSFLWAVYMQFTMGAVRVEDEHVIWLKLADTVS